MKQPKGSISRIITPDDNTGAQYFFGYYDLRAYSADDRYHLFHKVRFRDRLPEKEDTAELGYIDLETGEVTYFAETRAWNFQQGAMLQWNPASPQDEVIFNVRDGEGYRACTLDLKTGRRRYADRPVANVSPDGRWALSINLNRVYDFRPGYGYCGVRDPWYDVPQPDDDGVYLVDMTTGRSKLIIDYKRILTEFPSQFYPDAKYVVNHITFNPASDRFLFLNRNFPNPEKGEYGWKTSLFTSDLDGNLFPLLHDTMVSHYYWKNAKTILGYLSYGDRPGVYEIDDLSHDGVRLESPYFDRDIHTIYNPQRSCFIGDGYPDRNSERQIVIYDCATGESDVLLKEFSLAPKCGDNRCDLHNRWNNKGTKVSYDTTRRGKREIVELDMSYLYEEG